jgi:cell pole-organizing protein PopZ
MSDQTAQEPTMEEILASIRRIISEDEAPAAQPAAPADEPAAADAGAFSADLGAGAESAEEDVLELTDRVETHGDIDAYIPEAEPEPELEPIFPLEPEPAAAQAPPPAPAPADTLVSAATASAAASAFGQLSAAIAMPPLGLTLDEVVRELLRPLLKDWLDTHLPGIVQTAVAEEVERIARGRPR